MKPSLWLTSDQDTTSLADTWVIVEADDISQGGIEDVHGGGGLTGGARRPGG